MFQQTSYINSFTITIKFCEKRRSQLNVLLERQMDSSFGFPRRVKPLYDKVIKIEGATDSLMNEIEQIKVQLYKTDQLDEATLKKHKNIDNKLIEKLRISFHQYQQLIISSINEKWYKDLDATIDASLNTEDWRQIAVLNGKTRQVGEILAVLTKLQADIKIFENNLLYYLLYNTGVCDFVFYDISPIIKPESKTVYLGKEYKADIFLGVTDTTDTPIILMNDKALQVKQGKAIYSEKVTQTTGTVLRTGKIIMIQPATGDPIFIPFSFEYEVVE